MHSKNCKMHTSIAHTRRKSPFNCRCDCSLKHTQVSKYEHKSFVLTDLTGDAMFLPNVHFDLNQLREESSDSGLKYAYESGSEVCEWLFKNLS